jgi:hypothetical protein
VRDSIRILGRQYFQYGHWKWRIFRTHGRFGSPRQLAPSLFLTALVFALAAAVFHPVAAGWVVLGCLLLPPCVLVVVAEALRMARTRRAPWFTIAVALTTLVFPSTASGRP